MRITRAQFDPAAADELTRLMPDWAAAVRRLPGYRRHQGGVERENGRIAIVITFDTRGQADFPPEALGPAGARIRALGIRTESREVYKLVQE
jgi:hypothetical protein